MNDGSWLILVKVLGVLLAGLGFGWWQLRDVSRARTEARQDRASHSRDGPAAAKGEPRP
jgi:hypothetical protein